MGWDLTALLLDKTEKQLEALIWPLLPGPTVARCTSGGSYPEGNETTRATVPVRGVLKCGAQRNRNLTSAEGRGTPRTKG